MIQVCQGRDCEAPVDLAIRSLTPRNSQGLVSTLYQFPEDAPTTAAFYCVNCGALVAAGLAKLSNPEGVTA